mgnify:CR=1 FL=1
MPSPGAIVRTGCIDFLLDNGTSDSSSSFEIIQLITEGHNPPKSAFDRECSRRNALQPCCVMWDFLSFFANIFPITSTM